MKSSSVTIQMKTRAGLSCSETLVMWYTMILTSEHLSVNTTVKAPELYFPVVLFVLHCPR